MRAAAALLLLAAATPAGPDTADPLATACRERRSRLAAELGDGYALVLGQPLTDVLQPRQEGHFLYLAGVEDPDASLLLAGRRAAPFRIRSPQEKIRAREIVFLRATTPRFEQFLGLRYKPGADSARRLGVELTRPAPGNAKDFAARLAGLLPKKATLHVPRYGGPDHAPVREIRKGIEEHLKTSRPDVRFKDLHPSVAAMRAVKDAYEQQALRTAVSISLDAFRDALREIRPGSSEAAVDGALIESVRRRGARPAYAFVVAGGANGAIPHYFRNEDPLRAGDLLVIDAGAAFLRYAADVTRTFPVSGRFTKRQRELYTIVLDAQRAAIAAVRPGATFAKVDSAARTVIAKAGYGRHFIHATSHHVGLDVHDPGPRRLVPGMTLTVEPGIYIREEGIGIRIEDTVLVTRDGAEVLSGSLPKDPDEIEALLADR